MLTGMLDDIKACFFDMDGTLIDSMWMWKDIDIEFLGQRGIALPNDLQKRIEGKSFSETAHFFKNEFSLTESIEEIKAIWNNMAMKKYCSEVPLKEGAMEFLIKLRSKGIKTAIATSNSYELANACLSALNVTEYFDTIITSCMVGAGKPAPDIYLKCAADCGVSPADCMVFEDIPAGIRAGRSAGMKVCAVYDKYSTDVDDIKRKSSDYYINNYNQIIF